MRAKQAKIESSASSLPARDIPVLAPIHATSQSLFGTESISFPASSRLKPSVTRTEEGQRELDHDIEALIHRLERFKIRILEQRLGGSLAHVRTGKHRCDLPKPLEALNQALYGFGTRKPATPANGRALVASFNKLIDQRYTVDPLYAISRGEIKLIQKAFSAACFSKKPSTAEVDRLEHLYTSANRIQTEARTTKHHGDLFASQDLRDVRQNTLERLRLEYRALLKDYSTFEELYSWFSPTYGASLKEQRGSHQQSEPFSTDYQRNLMPEVTDLERSLRANYLRDWQYREHVETVLFPTGTNALHGILSYLDHETAQIRKTGTPRTILKTKDIYFEVDGHIQRHCGNNRIALKEFEPSDTAGLVREIQKSWPEAIFVNPLSNMFELRTCPVTQIVQSLMSDEFSKRYREKFPYGKLDNPRIHLIIDNTTAGRLARWFEIDFQKLPEFVKVISFESLVKFAQDGQELTQGALVTAIGEYLGGAICSVRKFQGTMPPESAIRRIAAYEYFDLVEDRMQRLSRNATILSGAIEAELQRGDFLSCVHYPGLKSHPDFQEATKELRGFGPLFSIGINADLFQGRSGFDGDTPEAREKESGIAFCRLVMRLAEESGISMHLGTSYGFDTTRIAAYERQEKLPRVRHGIDTSYHTYIRVATGTESIDDLNLIGRCILRANEIFTRAANEKASSDLARAIGNDWSTRRYAAKDKGVLTIGPNSGVTSKGSK